MTKSFSREAESLIASLRSMPDPGSIRKDSGAKGLDSLIESCVERWHIGQRTPEETIMDNWERIIGDAFARRSRPERITSSGVLIIQVANPIVRRELIFMEGRILTALGSLPGCGHINHVILKAGNG